MNLSSPLRIGRDLERHSAVVFERGIKSKIWHEERAGSVPREGNSNHNNGDGHRRLGGGADCAAVDDEPVMVTVALAGVVPSAAVALTA